MAVIKTEVPPGVKREFKELAKSQGKSQYDCTREAISMYMKAKKAQK